MKVFPSGLADYKCLLALAISHENIPHWLYNPTVLSTVQFVTDYWQVRGQCGSDRLH